MRQNSFEFRSQLHLLAVGNSQPTASAASGLWRRLAQIEFRATPEHPDKQLKEKFLDDLPGILASFLEGLKRWANRGHLPDAPPEIMEGVRLYETGSDPVSAFIAERTTADPDSRIEVNSLYQEYVAHFRSENGQDAEIFPKQRTFARRVSDLWGLPCKSNGKSYRAGRRLMEIKTQFDMGGSD